MTPKQALKIAQKSGGTNELRTIACKDPVIAYEYARRIDKDPTDETRTASCKDAGTAVRYAADIDKGPYDETRNAACVTIMAEIDFREVDSDDLMETIKFEFAEFAIRYAIYVDKGPHDITRAVSCKNPESAFQYAMDVDKKPRDDTRVAACGHPSTAYSYAVYVDGYAREDTFTVVKASKDKSAVEWYVRKVGYPDSWWPIPGNKLSIAAGNKIKFSLRGSRNMYGKITGTGNASDGKDIYLVEVWQKADEKHGFRTPMKPCMNPMMTMMAMETQQQDDFPEDAYKQIIMGITPDMIILDQPIS